MHLISLVKKARPRACKMRTVNGKNEIALHLWLTFLVKIWEWTNLRWQISEILDFVTVIIGHYLSNKASMPCYIVFSFHCANFIFVINLFIHLLLFIYSFIIYLFIYEIQMPQKSGSWPVNNNSDCFMYDCHVYRFTVGLRVCIAWWRSLIVGETCTFSFQFQGKNAKMCILRTLVHVYYNH